MVKAKGKTKSKSKANSKSKTKKVEEITIDTPAEEVIDNIENQNLEEDELVLNEDTLDLLEGMTDRLEETTDMAEKVKLHSEISQMTTNIKRLIDNLVQDVDDSKIIVDPSSVYPEDLAPNEKFDVMNGIHDLENELGTMSETDDLKKRVDIYAQLQRKCQILKAAADNGELIIRKCN
jgi:hypothetical protein